MASEELVNVFRFLLSECIRLRQDYNTFNALFDAGDEVSDLLREVAPLFFDDVHRLFVESHFLKAFRITDTKSLSVAKMSKMLENEGLMSEEIRAASKKVQRYHGIVERARNKAVGHIDVNVALSGETLGEHTETQINEFFEALQNYTDAVGRQIGEGPLDYRSTPGVGDVHDLIQALRLARSLKP